MPNADYVFNYFRSLGYTSKDAAAITGNLGVESNFNTQAKGDYRNGAPTAFGVAQWRNERVANFKRIMGIDVRQADLNTQLNFVDWELKNTHTNALYRMREARTVKDATRAITDKYEIPNPAYAHYDKRTSIAERVYNSAGSFAGVKDMLGKVLGNIPMLPGLPSINQVTGSADAIEEGANTLFSWIPRGVAILIGVILIGLAIAALVMKDNPVTNIVSAVKG